MRSKGEDVDVKTFEITVDEKLDLVETIWKGKDRVATGFSVESHEIGFCADEAFHRIDWDALRNSDNPEKIVIRSENYGKEWFINGKQVQPSIPLNSRPKDLCFTFMGDGEFEITDLELGDWRL